jgi:hypothetical protein
VALTRAVLRFEMVQFFFSRAKVTVRAKDVRVNSVFLVQLRKKVGASLAVEGSASSADGKVR